MCVPGRAAGGGGDGCGWMLGAEGCALSLAVLRRAKPLGGGAEVLDRGWRMGSGGVLGVWRSLVWQRESPAEGATQRWVHARCCENQWDVSPPRHGPRETGGFIRPAVAASLPHGGTGSLPRAAHARPADPCLFATRTPNSGPMRTPMLGCWAASSGRFERG